MSRLYLPLFAGVLAGLLNAGGTERFTEREVAGSGREM
jgi:hypothetical protein